MNVSCLRVVEHVCRAHPSSASLMAGSRTSVTVNFPLPNSLIVSTQAAAAPALLLMPDKVEQFGINVPGTVTELRSVRGMRPVSPRERAYSIVNFSGERPEPLSAFTVLVAAS